MEKLFQFLFYPISNPEDKKAVEQEIIQRSHKTILVLAFLLGLIEGGLYFLFRFSVIDTEEEFGFLLVNALLVLAYLVTYRVFFKKNAVKYIAILFPYLCLLISQTLSIMAFQRDSTTPLNYFTFIIGTLIMKVFYPVESILLYALSYLTFSAIALRFVGQIQILIPLLSNTLLLTIAVGAINLLAFHRYRSDYANRKRLRELLIEKTTAEREMRAAKEEADQNRKRAEKAAQAKSDFLANMSHEIRTPMNAIIGLNDLLGKTSLTAKQKDYVEKVANAAKNLMGILNDILDTSKIESGKMVLETVEFSLDETLDYLSNLLGKKAQEKGIELVLTKSPRVPPSLLGDSLRLGQVLINLCANAIKFTEKGEVVLTVSLVSRTETEARLAFAVRDTGIGMTPEQTGRLFSAFSQADASTTRRFGGTGLGLMISKNLVELMGGILEAQSEAGIGSLFTFEAAFGIGKKLPSAMRDAAISLRGLRALIVEDHAATRQVICEYADDLGLETLSVHSGEEAVSAADETFGLVLMDWKLPGIDGIEAWNQMKNKLIGKKLPKILFITAFDKDEVLKSLTDEESISVLTKPIRPSALLDAIMSLFGITKGNPDVSKPLDIDLDTIRGAKILLVEDNDINRQVAREILEAEGFWVDSAENGHIACEMARSHAYDLILMDLQMPELDGFGATQRIRADPSVRKNLPIIALSADVLSQTLQRAKESGINDAIPKPIDPATLFQTLKRWIPEGRRERFTVKEFSSRPAVNPDTKENQIEQLRRMLPSLRVDWALSGLSGNVRLFRDILKKFLQNYEGFGEDFERRLKKEDRETAGRMLHTLKGVSAQIGAKKIYTLTELSESALRENPHTDEKLDAQLITALEATLSEIRKFLPLQQEEGAPINLGHVPTLKEKSQRLKALELALENYDARAEDLYSEMRFWLDRPPWTEKALLLEKALKKYDFDNALEICREALSQMETEEKEPE